MMIPHKNYSWYIVLFLEVLSLKFFSNEQSDDTKLNSSNQSLALIQSNIYDGASLRKMLSAKSR